MSWIYNYYYNMVEDDAKNFIDYNISDGTYNADTDWDEVYDDMFDSNEVCGNASYAGHPDCFLVTYAPDCEKIGHMFTDERIRELLEDDYGDEVPWYDFVGRGQDGIIKMDAWIRTAMLGQLNDELYNYFKNAQENIDKE